MLEHFTLPVALDQPSSGQFSDQKFASDFSPVIKMPPVGRWGYEPREESDQNFRSLLLRATGESKRTPYDFYTHPFLG